jgi:hypothetical protein
VLEWLVEEFEAFAGPDDSLNTYDRMRPSSEDTFRSYIDKRGKALSAIY